MDRIEREILLNRLGQNIILADFDKLHLKNLEPLRREVEEELRKEVTKNKGKYADLKKFSE